MRYKKRVKCTICQYTGHYPVGSDIKKYGWAFVRNFGKICPDCLTFECGWCFVKLPAIEAIKRGWHIFKKELCADYMCDECYKTQRDFIKTLPKAICALKQVRLGS